MNEVVELLDPDTESSDSTNDRDFREKLNDEWLLIPEFKELEHSRTNDQVCRD